MRVDPHDGATGSAACHGLVHVDDVIRSLRTVRAFLPDPVPRCVRAEILELAACAPRTFNTQPWRLHVPTGAARRQRSVAAFRSIQWRVRSGHEAGRIAVHALLRQVAQRVPHPSVLPTRVLLAARIRAGPFKRMTIKKVLD